MPPHHRGDGGACERGPTQQCCCINTEHVAVRAAVAADDWSAAICHARKHAELITSREAMLRGHAVVCLPAVLVVGAQKAGSTAISAHFLANSALLPACSAARGRACTKELHFFDTAAARQTHVAAFVRYAGAFSDSLAAMAGDDRSLIHVPPDVCASMRVASRPSPVVEIPPNTPQNVEAVSEPMFGGGGRLEPPPIVAEHIDESDAAANVWRLVQRHAYASSFLSSTFTADATPSYMLSSSAMAAAAAMLPHAHVIVSLREPVARAYSEYHMKLRRVTAQTGIRSLPAFTEHVYPPLAACTNDSRKLDAVRACVVQLVMTHASLLAIARTRPLHDDSMLFTTPEAPRVPASMRGRQQPAAPVPFVSVVNCWTLVLLRPAPNARDAFECMYANNGELLPGIAAREAVQEFEAVTVDERAAIAACSSSCDATAGCMQLRDEVALCWPRGGVADISHDFLYRSVYATHLLKEKVHIIGAKALRRGDVAPIQAWMPVTDSGALRVLSAQEVDALIQARYGLLIQEGWQASSTYPAMHRELEQQLRAWFAPYNEALFELLGRRLEEGDW